MQMLIAMVGYQRLQNMTFEEVAALMSRYMPQEAPSKVVPRTEGEFGEVRQVFQDFGNTWTNAAVIQNRAAINFVDASAIPFLIPHYCRAAWSDGAISFDVLDYLVQALYQRRSELYPLLDDEQRRVVRSMLIFWDKSLKDSPATEVRRLVKALGQMY